MNYKEYKDLKVGDKIVNFKGHIGKIHYKKNKDCYYVEFNNIYIEYITKENYSNYILLR